MRVLPPLTGLRAFEAAARHMSFRKAAEELGVTPTAVSHAIEGLETHCGVRLFRRRPRPLCLTPEGEALFPVVRHAFDTVAGALATLRAEVGARPLRVTTTNAFAARWLLPRLPGWRGAYPELRLDVIGTDALLDLEAGEADVAIRYAREAPAASGLETVTLARDAFHVVASPALLRSQVPPLTPAAIVGLPLIACEWLPLDRAAPTWARWAAEAQRRGAAVEIGGAVGMSFREELHAIEAAIAGQGVAICSDILVAPELAAGTLVPVSDITLPGYAFHALFQPASPLAATARAFIAWLRGRFEAAGRRPDASCHMVALAPKRAPH